MGVERVRRPELDRTKPIRSFSSESAEAASQEGGFVEDGVRAAYTVLDAYLRQGRRVARELGRLPWPSLLQGSDSRERHARFLELTGELASNWFDLIGLVTESLVYAPRPDPSLGVRVAYEVSSARPALVQLEFLPGKATTKVRSLGLYGAAPSIPVRFSAPDEHCLVVQVQVPDDQPPGLYAGVVLSTESGRTVGALSLELR